MSRNHRATETVTEGRNSNHAEQPLDGNDTGTKKPSRGTTASSNRIEHHHAEQAPEPQRTGRESTTRSSNRNGDSMTSRGGSEEWENGPGGRRVTEGARLQGGKGRTMRKRGGRDEPRGSIRTGGREGIKIFAETVRSSSRCLYYVTPAESLFYRTRELSLPDWPESCIMAQDQSARISYR